MPYYDPEGTYVLWSSLYLIILGTVGFAVSHFSFYRQQLKVNFRGLSIGQNTNIINIIKDIGAKKVFWIKE